jgi:hypothetical protein
MTTAAEHEGYRDHIEEDDCGKEEDDRGEEEDNCNRDCDEDKGNCDHDEDEGDDCNEEDCDREEDRYKAEGVRNETRRGDETTAMTTKVKPRLQRCRIR